MYNTYKYTSSFIKNEFCEIFYAVRELLSNIDNASCCVFKFSPEYTTDEVNKILFISTLIINNA